VEDDRRFLYALAAGTAISGLLFWLAFWHGRILLGIAWGLTVCVLVWFRFGQGPRQWEHLRRHGTRREILEFKIFVAAVALGIIALAIASQLSDRGR